MTASEAKQLHQVSATIDHLLIIYPDVALSREDVDVRPRFPRSPGLAAVRVPERNVNTGDLLVLQEDANHLGERDVGAEGELADAIAFAVGVAVAPELAFEIGAGAADCTQSPAGDFERQ